MQIPENHISKDFFLYPENYWIEPYNLHDSFEEVFLPLIEDDFCYKGPCFEGIVNVPTKPGLPAWQMLLNPVPESATNIASRIAHEVIVMSERYHGHYLETKDTRENINERGYGSFFRELGGFLFEDKIYIVTISFDPDPWEPTNYDGRWNKDEWTWAWQLSCNEAPSEKMLRKGISGLVI